MADDKRTPRHRDLFARAVWESDMKQLQRLVALAYADHCRPGDEFAFVTYDRLQKVTGMSRDAVARALKGLVDAGWLELKEVAAQHRAARYWLRIPSAQQSASQTAEQSGRQTAEGSAVRETDHSEVPSSPSPDTSSPGDGLDLAEDLEEASHARTREAQLDAGAVQVMLMLSCDRAEARSIAENVLARNAARGKPIDNLAGYLSRIPAEDLRTRYGSRASSAKPSGATRCPHNVAGGERIVGSGRDASRVCYRCESESPAELVAVAS